MVSVQFTGKYMRGPVSMCSGVHDKKILTVPENSGILIVVIPPAGGRLVRSKRKTETFTEYLEKMIITGDMHPGERLPPERELAQMTGVSRPVVHESLVKIESKGLVRIIPRHGVSVCDYRSDGVLGNLAAMLEFGGDTAMVIESFYELRRSVEPNAASLAASNATLDDLSILEDLLMKEYASAGEDPEASAELYTRFHAALLRSSGNLVYPLLVNTVSEAYQYVVRRMTASHEPDTLLMYHRGVIDALMAGDSLSASRVMGSQLVHERSLLFEEECPM